MKKKILSGIIAVFVMAVFTVVVNAESVLNLPFLDYAAKAPTTIPSAGTQVYAVTTDGFDFSGVKFKDASGNIINGKTDLEKIIVGTIDKSKIVNIDTDVNFNEVFTNWFTAYCLDGTKKYPQYGILRYGKYYNDLVNGEDAELVNDILRVAFANDNYKSYYNTASSYLGQFSDPTFTYTLPDGEDEASIAATFGENTQVTISVTSVCFTELSISSPKKLCFVTDDAVKSSLVGVTRDEALISGSTATKIDINAKLDDLAFQKYYAKNNNEAGVSNLTNAVFGHALWIVEHSYPTLPIRTSLEVAGANYDTLITEIKDANASLSDAEAAKWAEAYVFGTVQYAIWKVTGYEVEGVKLGNQITNYEELDKLYGYLIQSRDEYSSYVDPSVYTNEITTTSPEQGKELYKKTNDAFIYGPFKASYNALVENENKMALTIKNEDKTGIKIVDKDLHEIASVAAGEEFYISVDKKASVGSVAVGLSLDNVVTFSPASNRARIYTPLLSVGQNALSGGKVTNITITGDLQVVTNAKTGVQNVALLLMVTLVAFTLGYLVLSYKSKPVELQ